MPARWVMIGTRSRLLRSRDLGPGRAVQTQTRGRLFERKPPSDKGFDVRARGSEVYRCRHTLTGVLLHVSCTIARRSKITLLLTSCDSQIATSSTNSAERPFSNNGRPEYPWGTRPLASASSPRTLCTFNACHMYAGRHMVPAEFRPGRRRLTPTGIEVLWESVSRRH